MIENSLSSILHNDAVFYQKLGDITKEEFFVKGVRNVQMINSKHEQNNDLSKNRILIVFR
jgi:hypothetical protein